MLHRKQQVGIGFLEPLPADMVAKFEGYNLDVERFYLNALDCQKARGFGGSREVTDTVSEGLPQCFYSVPLLCLGRGTCILG